MDNNEIINLKEIVNDERTRQQDDLENVAISKKYAILDRVLERAKRFGVDVPQVVLEEIGDLVMSVPGAVAVTTRRTSNPTIVKHDDMAILEYKLEKADRSKTNKPYLLSIWFIRPEQNNKSVRAVRMEKWILGKGVPFVPEVMKRLDENKDVTIYVYRDVRSFALQVARLEEFSDDDFVGQNVKNCRFSKNTAVGLVKNNIVIIYAPAWMFDKSTWTFYVR